MFKHVLIPTDGTELSQQAVTGGVAFAKSIGARITVVTSSPSFHVLATKPLMVSDTKEQYMKDAEALAQKRLQAADAIARGAGVRCDTVHVFNDHPHRAILETALDKSCNLIFMASHGRGGVAALLLGSETQKVLTHGKIPVLVWR